MVSEKIQQTNKPWVGSQTTPHAGPPFEEGGCLNPKTKIKNTRYDKRKEAVMFVLYISGGELRMMVQEVEESMEMLCNALK